MKAARLHLHAFAFVVVVVVVVLLAAAPLRAQQSTDLIKGFQQDSILNGTWQPNDGKLLATGERARAILADSVPKNYSLTTEFTRTEGDDSIGIVLPVGESQCLLNLSAFNGEAHGIGIIDGRYARDNETTIRPGRLENDHTYRLLIEVSERQGNWTIGSQLDGRPFLSWKGKAASLSMMDQWKLNSAKQLGLFTNCGVTFHRLVLRPLDPSMRMTDQAGGSPNPSTAPSTIRFQQQTWVTANADSAEVKTYQDRPALHVTGNERTFVYLQNETFSDGVIEVDIAADTFCGIGFRANNDGTVVEKLYLRPFNSGTAKHENTVQYSMLGRPKFGWRQLREDFPGKYEAGADVRSLEWFHLKVRIEGQKLTAWVNDDSAPVITVDPLLGDRSSGKLGFWTWNGRFSNFTFTPATK